MCHGGCTGQHHIQAMWFCEVSNPFSHKKYRKFYLLESFFRMMKMYITEMDTGLPGFYLKHCINLIWQILHRLRIWPRLRISAKELTKRNPEINQGELVMEASWWQGIMLKWRMSISNVNADQNLCPTILLREGSLKHIWTTVPSSLTPSPPPTGWATLNILFFSLDKLSLSLAKSVKEVGIQSDSLPPPCWDSGPNIGVLKKGETWVWLLPKLLFKNVIPQNYVLQWKSGFMIFYIS